MYADDGTAGVHSGNMAEAGRLIRIDGSLGIYKKTEDGWDVLDFAVRTGLAEHGDFELTLLNILLYSASSKKNVSFHKQPISILSDII